MASLKLLDTGYISNETLASQTQLSDANRAGYTGSAVSGFTLKSATVTLASKSSVENKPIINTVTDSNTSLVSVSNRVFKVSCILAKTITSAGWSVNDVYQLLRMDRTKGLKLLYPSGTSDTMKTIVEALGAVNTNGNFAEASPTDDEGTVSTTTPYLIGRVKNINLRDESNSKSYWRFDFDFEIST